MHSPCKKKKKKFKASRTYDKTILITETVILPAPGLELFMFRLTSTQAKSQSQGCQKEHSFPLVTGLEIVSYLQSRLTFPEATIFHQPGPPSYVLNWQSSPLKFEVGYVLLFLDPSQEQRQSKPLVPQKRWEHPMLEIRPVIAGDFFKWASIMFKTLLCKNLGS